MTTSFPEGFLCGTATAAHQVEGGNVNNDHWEMEHAPHSPFVESSGDACDSWHRWEEDLDLIAGAGLNTYRFSLEWSRIEPEEGEVSRAALDHHRRIADVRGYVDCSLLDNSEWMLDFAPAFALVAVDRETFARTPRPSLAWLGDVARRNGLPE